MANEQTPVPGIPGANVLAVIMAAPTDILGLATRQVTEAVSVFNFGVQKLGAEVAKPPILPAGLPALPAGFPLMPGMAGFQPPAPQGFTPAGPQAQAFTTSKRLNMII